MLGLDLCTGYTRGSVSCYSDSELLVKQLNGEYKARDMELRLLFGQVQELAEVVESVTFTHVRRDDPRIVRVDRIANDRLDAEEASKH